MKQIAVTQRVVIEPSYGERRDALDQKWIDFLISADLFPIVVPNQLEHAQLLLEKVTISGVLLTGGNSLEKYGGDAPERDSVELMLLEWAMINKLPVLGVCRGMQLIQDYYGNMLRSVENHIATRHTLTVNDGGRLSSVVSRLPDVNAYHELGTENVDGELVKIATAEDGIVMAIEHTEKPVYGVMWHSERECPFSEIEQELFRTIFN